MDQKRYIFAPRQGTTGSRAVVFHQGGRTVSIAQKKVAQNHSTPRWVVYNPFETLAPQSATAAEAVAMAIISGDQNPEGAVTGQRGMTIVWDRKTGRSVYPAIVWQDRRTADELKHDGVETFGARKTGLRFEPYFPATKLRWLLANVPGAQHAVDRSFDFKPICSGHRSGRATSKSLRWGPRISLALRSTTGLATRTSNATRSAMRHLSVPFRLNPCPNCGRTGPVPSNEQRAV